MILFETNFKNSTIFYIKFYNINLKSVYPIIKLKLCYKIIIIYL